VAEKVLPAVIPHTLDAAPDVRVEAFKVVDALLVGLREESQKMAKDEADRISAATCGMNAQSVDNGGGGGIAAAPNSGSYLSGLWSATTTTEVTPRMGGAAVDRKIIAANSNSNASNGPAVPPTSRSPAAPKFSSLSLSDAQIGGASNYGNGDDGGWSDDDVDIPGSSPAKSAVGGWNDLGGKLPLDDEDGDDFFASFDSRPKPIIPGGGKSVSLGTRKLSSGMSSITTASKAAPQMQPSGMVLKKQQPKPVVKKLPTSSDMDGWDDF